MNWQGSIFLVGLAGLQAPMHANMRIEIPLMHPRLATSSLRDEVSFPVCHSLCGFLSLPVMLGLRTMKESQSPIVHPNKFLSLRS